MNIVVIGAGTVGSTVCIQLVKEGHNVTVIDRNEDHLSKLADNCDVIGIVGSGTDVATLKKAGVEEARLLIAATSGDELNLLCCAMGRKLGARHTIARVRNPEYSDMMRLLRTDFNLSLAINPEQAVAKEIYRGLRFPAAAKIDTFFRGRVELAEFEISEGSPICDITLNALRSKLNMRFLICGVLRNGEAIVPTGTFSLQAGDKICVTAPEEEIADFFKALGAYKQPVKNVLIVGGGRVTHYLLSMLSKSKIKATVVDDDMETCRELTAAFPCVAICADQTDQEVLQEEGIESTDAFLALSNNDEENLISSMYAATCGTRKIITMIQKMQHAEFLKNAGLQTLVSPKHSSVEFILRYIRSLAHIRGSEIESLHQLVGGQIEAIEFLVNEDLPGITDLPIKTLNLHSGVLIACILHNEKVIIPTGSDMISKGDSVIVVTKRDQMKGLKDILK